MDLSPPDSTVPPQPKPLGRAFSLKKKILFTAVLLVVVGVPVWLTMETVYRLKFGLPIAGGFLDEDHLKNQTLVSMDDPRVRKFLSQ
ncbi:MAG: hypothetical protein ABGZ24_01545, partial [Fuerstiella sp.]